MGKKANGFTIVELLVVIIVIAILAAVSIVAYNGVQTRSRDAIRQSDIKLIAKALEMYYLDNGQYPVTATDNPCVNESNVARSGCPSWTELQTKLSPYVSKLPIDPQNRGGDTGSPAQHTYIYWPIANNNDNMVLGGCASSKPYQSYFITYFPENSSATQNIFNGSCSSTTPNGYFGGTYGRLYYSIKT